MARRRRRHARTVAKVPVVQVADNVSRRVRALARTLRRQLYANRHGYSADDILGAIGDGAKHVSDILASAEKFSAPVATATETAASGQ